MGKISKALSLTGAALGLAGLITSGVGFVKSSTSRKIRDELVDSHRQLMIEQVEDQNSEISKYIEGLTTDAVMDDIKENGSELEKYKLDQDEASRKTTTGLRIASLSAAGAGLVFVFVAPIVRKKEAEM